MGRADLSHPDRCLGKLLKLPLCVEALVFIEAEIPREYGASTCTLQSQA